MTREQNDPRWSQVTWNLQQGVHSQDVPIDVYMPESAESAERRVHIYPGLGERYDAVRLAAEYLTARGVPAVGVDAPFYLVDTKYREAMAREVPAQVAAVVKGKADLLGRSLGYIMAAVGGAHAPEQFESVAGIGPAMPTYQYWAKNRIVRRASFAAQLTVYNNLVSPPEAANVNQAWAVLRELWQYRKVGGITEAMDHGTSDHVGSIGLQALRTMHEVSMPHRNFLPCLDLVFPRKYQEQALLANGCDPSCMTVVDGVHSNSRAQLGLQQSLDYAGWVVALATSQAEVPAATPRG